jgi:hypothetical protein
MYEECEGVSLTSNHVQENGSHSPTGEGATRVQTRGTASPVNEDEANEDEIPEEKRPKRWVHSSSSDSDSGGSCFSDQACPTRGSSRARRSRKKERNTGGNSKSNGGNSGRQCVNGKESGRRVPPLCRPVSDGDCGCHTSDVERRRCDVPTEGVSEGESSTEGSFVVSLTSSYDIETGYGDQERVFLPTCPPPLDSRPPGSAGRDESPKSTAREKKKGSSSWVDEELAKIVERTVNNFASNMQKLSSATAF